jgi:hypothetical protein
VQAEQHKWLLEGQRKDTNKTQKPKGKALNKQTKILW